LATKSQVVAVGLLVRLEAREGRETDVESFLDSGQALVEEEPDTIAGFGIRLGPSTFGIFDVFPDETENAGELFGEPSIEQVDVIASKLPG
jgi:hypothetical protein